MTESQAGQIIVNKYQKHEGKMRKYNKLKGNQQQKRQKKR